MADKTLKFFMRSKEPEIVKCPAPPSFKNAEGKPIELEIKVLSEAELDKINNYYRTRTIATDKKGNPLVQGGEVVFKVEKDNARAGRHIIAEALVYPDLKDKELMDYYNCHDITEMPRLVFSKPGEFLQVQRAVMATLGLVDGEAETEKDLENAKN